MTALLLQLALACICLLTAVGGYRSLLRLQAPAAEPGTAQLFSAPRLLDGGAAWLFGLAIVGPAIIYLLVVVLLARP